MMGHERGGEYLELPVEQLPRGTQANMGDILARLKLACDLP